MYQLHYSRRAEDDLDEIALYSLENWGAARAGSYMDDLHEACRVLIDFPLLGRRSRKGRFRTESASHVILYSFDGTLVTIQRILHKSRLLP